MKVLIDWDERPSLYLRFPGDAAYGVRDGALAYQPSWDAEGFSGEELADVPADIAARWRDTRDAWRSLVREVERFRAEQGVTQ